MIVEKGIIASGTPLVYRALSIKIGSYATPEE
jgi:hypothetical protein